VLRFLAQNFFFFPPRPLDRLCGPLSPIQSGPRLSFRAGRSGREADHSPPSGADVRNEWSYTFTSPTRFHGEHRIRLQFVINICGRGSWENVGKACWMIHKGENARTIGRGVKQIEAGSCKCRNEITTCHTAQLSGDGCLSYCCARFNVHLTLRCRVYFKWAIVSTNASNIL